MALQVFRERERMFIMYSLFLGCSSSLISCVIFRLVEPKAVVFECGANCSCYCSCVNRTSQQGLQYRLEVVLFLVSYFLLCVISLLPPVRFISRARVFRSLI